MEVKRPGDNRFIKALIFGPPGQGKTYLLGTAQEDERTAPMLFWRWVFRSCSTRSWRPTG